MALKERTTHNVRRCTKVTVLSWALVTLVASELLSGGGTASCGKSSVVDALRGNSPLRTLSVSSCNRSPFASVSGACRGRCKVIMELCDVFAGVGNEWRWVRDLVGL